MTRPIVVVALLASLATCSGQPPTPSGIAVRTVDFSGACAGVGLDATVRGDPRDPSVAWLASMTRPGPVRIEVAWPAGDIAVFDPTLRILDAHGRVVIREGEYVDGGCVTDSAADAPLFIPNPADAFRLECGSVERSACTNVLNAVRYRSHAWPADPVATFITRDPTGGYTIVLEDGRQLDGRVAPNA